MTTALSLAGAGLALAGNGPQPLPGQLPGPPPVRVEIRGQSARAGAGSSCWSTGMDDGTSRTVCADVAGPITGPTLPARGKRMVHIDMGAPTLRLTAGLPGKRFRDPWPTDPTRRHWIVRLPRRLERSSVLSLGGSFSQGEVPYAVTLRRSRG
ncbi:MAG: hypothetical protein JW895_16535 [Thermoleophilaceae bacterium]|nr:hypothetical protein [Thermoleophilaceae bacterium]